jgi:hypothetical protein
VGELPPLEHEGRTYGLKGRSFEELLDLPRRAGRRFELAVGAPAEVRARLEAHGWMVRDPRPVTRDVPSYLSYVRDSKAELGVAKHGYVVSRSGWFSERSATYLAAGRPVLVQDTGFTDWLGVEEGVVAFTTPEEAIAGLEEIDGRYERHCRAAREVAVEVFDSRRVLTSLLERLPAG